MNSNAVCRDYKTRVTREPLAAISSITKPKNVQKKQKWYAHGQALEAWSSAQLACVTIQC